MIWAEIFAAFRWWAIILLLGTMAVPLSFKLLHRLPDKGYAFTKMLGLLIASYLFWILGSLGFVGNNVGGILLALFILVGLSIWAWRSAEESLVSWLRENGRFILTVELLFTLIFVLWVWVRANNPAIAATEKPMEFAFLNAVGRSPSFPPIDPWLSGYAISYYYFGYVMISLIARLAAVAEPIAFNLGIAWLVAGTAIGAFGLVYNLIASSMKKSWAVALGVVAALALPIVGNQQITLEVAHANAIGSADFWTWLNVRDINTSPEVGQTPRYESTGWWWWRSSRVIHEHHLSGRAETGLEPIVEFPGFSFILGDMHPHVLALPFAFLSLGIAFAWFLQSQQFTASLRPRELLQNIGWPLSLLTIIMLGGLSFLNTWDVLIHLFVVLMAFLLGQWARRGWQAGILNQAVVLAFTIVIPAILLYLPFYLGFRSQAGAPYMLPMLMRPTRLPHFLIIFGMPLSAIVIFLLRLGWQMRFRRWLGGLITVVSLITTLLVIMFLLGWLIAVSAEGAGRIIALADELAIILPPRPPESVAFGWGFTAVLQISPVVLSAKLAYPGVTLLLATILGLIMIAWVNLFQSTNQPINQSTNQPIIHSSLPFVLLLILTAALLTIGPEFLYLRDNFGVRLNTTFKFYYQSWTLYGVAALYAIAYLWHTAQGTGRLLPSLASASYAIMFAMALLFPYYAVQSRSAEYRGSITAAERLPLTLDGLARTERFNPDEYAAIKWLRANMQGDPTVLEAVGGQYSEYGRISASTGLPTVLGWAGHQYQWRGSDNPEPAYRDPLIRQLYERPDWGNTPELLDELGIDLIYVGELERRTYGEQGIQKFEERLEPAFATPTVIIYRWQPEEDS